MTTVPDGAARHVAESSRVEAFSDGVFAIAVTLLVLDLHAEAPRGRFASSLLDQWPTYVAYLAAFLNISAIWINHHDLFSRVRKVDARLICANLGLLLVASLFPWPAAVISAASTRRQHRDQVAATVLYAGVGLLVPLAWIVVYRYLAHTADLLSGPDQVAFVRAASRRSLVSVVVYPLAAAVALVQPALALIAFAALPLFFIGTLIVSGGGRLPSRR